MTHQAPTPEYVRSLRGCWTESHIDRAIADADYPDPPTWSWFLGARLDVMSADDVVHRYSVALRHMQRQKIDAPDARPLAEHWRAAKDGTITPAALLVECAALGVYLDTI